MDAIILMPSDPLRALAAADLAAALRARGHAVTVKLPGAGLPQPSSQPCLVVIDDGQTLGPLRRRFPEARFLRLCGPGRKIARQIGRLFHACRDVQVHAPGLSTRGGLVPQGLAAATPAPGWLQSMPADLPTVLVCPAEHPVQDGGCWQALNGGAIVHANQIWCIPADAPPQPRRHWSQIYVKPGFDPAWAIGKASLAVVEADGALALRLLASGLPVVLVDGEPAMAAALGRCPAARVVATADLSAALHAMLSDADHLIQVATATKTSAEARSAPGLLGRLKWLGPSAPVADPLMTEVAA